MVFVWVLRLRRIADCVEERDMPGTRGGGEDRGETAPVVLVTTVSGRGFRVKVWDTAWGRLI